MGRDSTADLLQLWRTAYEQPVPDGWDFSEFDGRMEESEPPWDFESLVRNELSGANSVLDIGTGGGEFLLRFADVLPTDTHATEGWSPNLPVARAALEPRGVHVAEYDADRGDRLPYPDARFDAVLSRHESYSAAEVARVVRPGGRFLTQQVDGRNLADLARLFDEGPAYPTITLDNLRAEACAAGFDVELAEEWTGPIAFSDVGTLVSYLRLMPWQLPGDFTVDRYAKQLLELHHSDEPPVFTEAVSCWGADGHDVRAGPAAASRRRGPRSAGTTPVRQSAGSAWDRHAMTTPLPPLSSGLGMSPPNNMGAAWPRSWSRRAFRTGRST